MMYNKLLVNKIFEVDEAIDSIVDKLSNLAKEDHHLEKVSDWKYFFMANESYGTLSNYGITGGIRLYLSLDYEDENKTRIMLKTKPRLELILYTLISLSFIFIQISEQSDIPIWVNFVNIIVLIFGWFFYRKQEMSLLRVSEPKLMNVLEGNHINEINS